MKARTLTALTLSLVMAMNLAACGSSSDSTSSEEAEETEESGEETEESEEETGESEEEESVEETEESEEQTEESGEETTENTEESAGTEENADAEETQDISENGAAADETAKSGNVQQITLVTDGVVTLADEMYYNLYASKDPEQGVRELLEEGCIYVNDVVVSEEGLEINGEQALWEEEDGTWSWYAHVMYYGDGLTYEEAAYELVNGLTLLRGPEYTLTITDGVVTRVDFTICGSLMAETVTVGEDTTVITLCGDEDETMEFANELVEPDSEGNMPEDQTMGLYWLDEEGWHLKRADSTVITVYGEWYAYLDAFISLKSEPYNRPNQPILCLDWSDTTAEITQWFYSEDITIGFSHVNGQEDLLGLIEKAEELYENTPVYSDASEAAEGEAWVTQEYHDVFSEVLEEAKAVAQQDGLLNTQYDEQFYNLALAYGADGTWYAMQGCVYEDGVGFKLFAEQNAES